MANIMDEYKKEFEKEADQFLFLCNKSDVKILLKKYKKQNMGEYVRLACIALVFQYRLIFLKIAAAVERDMDDFLKGMDIIDGNFALLESWVEGFIKRIGDKDAQDIVRECWEERKEKIDKDNFTIQQIN